MLRTINLDAVSLLYVFASSNKYSCHMISHAPYRQSVLFGDEFRANYLCFFQSCELPGWHREFFSLKTLASAVPKAHFVPVC